METTSVTVSEEAYSTTLKGSKYPSVTFKVDDTMQQLAPMFDLAYGASFPLRASLSCLHGAATQSQPHATAHSASMSAKQSLS